MTVCFTGHRDLGSLEEQNALRQALDEQLKVLIAKGACVFLAGGALGFDTLAASAVLNAKREHPQVRLHLLLPCRDQCARWTAQQTERYRKILEQADGYTYLSDAYYRGVMHKRNRALVDGADICVAFLRSGAAGGTAYTVKYAAQKGVPVINLAQSR